MTISKNIDHNNDPQMNEVVKTRLQNPNMTSDNALITGGFVFEGTSSLGHNVFANEGVSLRQRNMILLSRLVRLKDNNKMPYYLFRTGKSQ